MQREAWMQIEVKVIEAIAKWSDHSTGSMGNRAEHVVVKNYREKRCSRLYIPLYLKQRGR